MKARKTITLCLDDILHKQIKEYIEERGMTFQGLLTVLVKRELAKAKKENE